MVANDFICLVFFFCFLFLCFSLLIENCRIFTYLSLNFLMQEVIRIKNEHPDDSQCIVNDRVKGRLKVTRAFGAGFLKQVSNYIFVIITCLEEFPYKIMLPY